MRRRRGREAEDEAEVPMSPLIDCVFLLLIFFLVTTMIKRKEKLIPIQLPDMSSAVSKERKDKSLILGLGAGGSYFEGHVSQERSRDKAGELVYTPIANLNSWVQKKVLSEGKEVLSQSVRIDADREVSFDDAVVMIDILKLEGFSDVGIKTRQRARAQ
ncbi:MAG: biopolymer transporter ExbD [Planctomycetes bacterium]|nr:biopolymer transporter ExbD [Planctomycetota bacterium]